MTPSSTSSSRQNPREPRSASGVALKTLVAGLLVFGVTVGIYNGLLQLLYAGGGDINGRMLTQLEMLPEIASANHDKHRVFVFGSSMVQAGFEPAVFDKAMSAKGIEVISYNYGVGNLNPEFQELITRRIREQFVSQNEKLALTLIEFNPFQATKVRKSFTNVTADQNLAVLATNSELWEITMLDPTRGIRLFNIRYLRDGFSAELITSIPAIFTSNLGPRGASKEYQEAAKRTGQLSRRFRELRDQDAPIQGSDQWNAALRGGRIDKSRLSTEALVALGQWAESARYSGFMENDLFRRVRTADILELRFDDEVIKAFVAMVTNLRAVSEVIEVILLPRNPDWITYTPEVQQRLDEVLRHIENETGVQVRNFQVHANITPAHFLDTTHLSYYDGIDIFTEILADEYADALEKLR